MIFALLLLAASAQAADLTLSDAVRQALAASPALEAAREEAALAGFEEPLLLANLDPVLESQATTGEDRFPRDSPAFQGPFARQQTFDVALRQQTLLGTTARLAWTNRRIQNPAPFRAIDPSVESRLAIEVRQPLLRYFWGRPDRARRLRARAGVAVARGRLRQAETDAAAGAARAFIEAEQARRQVGIREKGLADSRRLLAKHADKKRYGLVEDSDLLQTEVSVELADTELQLALTTKRLAERALAEALHLSSAPATAGGEVPAPPAALDPAARGDLAAARAEAERAEWNVRAEKLDTMPDLSVFGTYAFGGLGGSFSPAYDDLRTWDHPAKQGGVSLSVPFGGTRESLARRAAQARSRSAAALYEAARLRVERELADALDRLELAERQAKTASRLVELEAGKHRAESDNYERGRSSTDLVLRFQADVRRAEAQAVRAAADLQLARLEALRASGTLLDVMEKQP